LSQSLVAALEGPAPSVSICARFAFGPHPAD
jgi:hypothetical protein